jgi:predicted transposase YbfD/YdcC
MDILKLKEEVSKIADPRRQWGNIRHKLEDILIIGLATLICNGYDYGDMETFGLAREADLRKFLELPNGIPDESTFTRVFRRLDPKALSESLYSSLNEVRDIRGQSINIDGKAIRGSACGEGKAVHVVSAWVGEKQIVLGEVAVDEKSNEIKAIPKLLKLFDIKGATITIDAMGCQTDIAEMIATEEAAYVLAVKDNQQTLHSEIKDYFEGLESGEINELPEDIWETPLEKEHGRPERREVRSVTDIDWLSCKENWVGLKTIIQYRCHRNEKTTDSYYISNADISAMEFYKHIRGHWSIENNLHWSLDMIFAEDGSIARMDNSPENLNILRKTALSLLRATNEKLFVKGKRKMSAPKKRFAASIEPNYMFDILFPK